MSRTFRQKKARNVFYYYWLTNPANDMLSEDDADDIVRRFFSERSFVTCCNSNADDRRYAGKSLRKKLKQSIDHQSLLKAEMKKRKYNEG